MGEDFPQEFGQYTLHELIGRGGMAEIYRASMPGIGGFEKTVAIKKILPHLAEDEEFTTMLVDEARIIESLDHSNIAQVFDLGKLDGSYYIAMEYIHGVDLSEVIEELERRDERIPIPHVIYIISSICAGLHFAHSKTDDEGNPLNVIHRDISPHNIRISFAGEVKIIDFGVAKAADREARTKMGVIKGKLLYMAPEQAKAEDLDGRADLFSAGLCAYRMLTGELPFEGENEFQVYNNVLQEEIAPPKKLRPDIPDELNRIVMKLLERDPADRYQEGYAAKQDLDTLLHEAAPGYTVNRLSRFVEENFSHLVQTEGAGHQTESSNPSGLSPSTPSRPAPGTGKQNPDDLEPTGDDADTARESVPASESVEESTQAARPQQIPPAERSNGAIEERAAAPEPPEVPDSSAQPEADASEPSTSEEGVPPVVYAIGLVLVAIAGMVGYAVSVGGDAGEGSGNTARIEKSGRAAEAAATSDSMVRINLDSTPSGAKLVRKGETVGETPATFALPKSEEPLELSLRKEGYRREEVELVPSEDLERTVQLSPSPGTRDDAQGADADRPDGGRARVARESSGDDETSKKGASQPDEPTGERGSPGDPSADDDRGARSAERAASDDSDDESSGSFPKIQDLEIDDEDESSSASGGASGPSAPSGSSSEPSEKPPESSEEKPDAGNEIIDPFNM